MGAGALGAQATLVLSLILAFKAVRGWRISTVIGLQRKQLHADGIRTTTKGGKRELWEWSPELRRIIAAAEQLPGSTRFPASPVFPHSRGKAFAYGGFNSALRSKVHDDAEAMGRPGYEVLGNTARVAQKHYARRDQRRRPLR